jgi:hypothetical protein
VDVDIDRFALILAERLAAIVPAGFSVTARDGMLWYSAGPGMFPGQRGDYRVGSAGTYVRANFGVHGETAEEQLAGLAAQALDELQDYVDEATHEPWPGTRAQPQARAGIRGQALHLWYGGPELETDTVLACEPIPLAELSRTPSLFLVRKRRRGYADCWRA